MNNQLLSLHVPADNCPCHSAAHWGEERGGLNMFTCGSYFPSLCPLDGEHTPLLCNPKQLNSQSLSAVLKCPATRCTQQQHLNEEEAARSKWCRIAYEPERERLRVRVREREVRGRNRGRMRRAIGSNACIIFCIYFLLCPLHLFI